MMLIQKTSKLLIYFIVFQGGLSNLGHANNQIDTNLTKSTLLNQPTSDLKPLTTDQEQKNTLNNLIIPKIEEVKKPLINLLSDPIYLQAESKVLDAARLLDVYNAQLEWLMKGIELKSRLYIEFTKDSFLGIVELNGETQIKGYIKFDFSSRICTMNFGLEYGYAKVILSQSSILPFLKKLDFIKSLYKIEDLQKAIFEYDRMIKFDKEHAKRIDIGKLDIELNSKKTTRSYNSEELKDSEPIQAFWQLTLVALNKAKLDSKETKDAQKMDAYDAATSEATKHIGIFTLYRRKNELLLELSESDLGKLIVMQAAIHSSGAGTMARPGESVTAGRMRLDEEVFRWEKKEDFIALVRPQTKYRWEKGGDLEEASKLSFPEAILGSFKIEAENPEKKLYLINVTDLFLGNIVNLDEAVRAGGAWGYSLDRNTSLPDTIKSFPENLVVRMDMHYRSGDAGAPQFNTGSTGLNLSSKLENPTSLGLKVTYNLWYYKPTGYRPRLADDRIGYFTEDHVNLEKILKFDHTIKFINRFNLKKIDPKAKLSEPVKPIVWMIDPSIPQEFRPAIREGILRWSPAFEAIGFKNALVVKDAPKNDPNWDHADGRYNVIRWVVDDFVCDAIMRTDPFTGEILNAGISIDATYLKAYSVLLYPGTIQPDIAALKIFSSQARQQDLKIEDIYRNFKHQQQFGHLLTKDSECCKDSKHLKINCNHSKNTLDHYAFAIGLANAQGIAPPISKEEILHQALTDTISHEVGHCLGLRHNFKGAAFASTAQLADDQFIKTYGTTASVMDYVPVNIQKVLTGKGSYFPNKIGVYDMWAIRYGYSEIPAISIEGEKAVLEQIARESGKPGHAFATDQDLMSPDPYVQQRVYASDPIEYSKKVILASKKFQDYFTSHFLKNGKSSDKNAWLLLKTIQEVFQQGFSTSKFIGGMEISRTLPGDIGYKSSLKPINPILQRQAMQLITKEVFSIDSINLPDHVLNNLSKGYGVLYDPTWNAPLRTFLHFNQAIMVMILLDFDILGRITENQFKANTTKNVYSLIEHFKLMSDAIFGDLKTNNAIKPLRQDLQRVMLMKLISLAENDIPIGFNGIFDVKLIANAHLHALKAQMEKRLHIKTGLTEMNELHLKSMIREIDNFLKKTPVKVKFSLFG